MEQTRNRSTSPPLGPRMVGCPYLGVKSDPQTRFSTSSTGNYCHRVQPAEPVALEHQEGYCLGERHVSCVVYSAQWKNGLPAELRGDGESASTRSSPWVVHLIEGLRQRFSRTPPPPSPKSETTIKEAEDEVDMFRRLHQEARSQVARYPVPVAGAVEPPSEAKEVPRRKRSAAREERLQPVWIILLVVGIVVIAFSVWGVMQRISQIQQDADNAGATAVAAIDLATALQQTSLYEQIQTSTAAAYTPTPLPATFTPSPTAFSPEEATQHALATELTGATQAALALGATLTASVSCEDESGYRVEVVSGPVLFPPLGTFYYEGSTPPSAQATWTLRNNGACDWSSLVLLYPNTTTTLVPVLRHEGAIVDLATHVVRPGDELELSLAFNGANAYSVKTEYLYVINGITLNQHPLLSLDVTGWISMYARPTNTPRPGGGGGGGAATATSGPGRPTPTEPVRP